MATGKYFFISFFQNSFSPRIWSCGEISFAFYSIPLRPDHELSSCGSSMYSSWLKFFRTLHKLRNLWGLLFLEHQTQSQPWGQQHQQWKHLKLQMLSLLMKPKDQSAIVIYIKICNYLRDYLSMYLLHMV